MRKRGRAISVAPLKLLTSSSGAGCTHLLRLSTGSAAEGIVKIQAVTIRCTSPECTPVRRFVSPAPVTLRVN